MQRLLGGLLKHLAYIFAKTGKIIPFEKLNSIRFAPQALALAA